MFEDTHIMKHDEYSLYSEAIARTQAIMDEHDFREMSRICIAPTPRELTELSVMMKTM